MTTLVFIGLAGSLAHAMVPVTLPRYRYTKNGGMRFLRIGKLQLSWCICKKSI